MIDQLCRLGYTPREAAFLEFASLGGYFVRRQFETYAARKSGAICQRFIERGISLGHFNAQPALGGRIVYHLGSSAFYEVLGDGTNRNRRRHSPDTVRQRLMALDLVLALRESAQPIRRIELVQTFLSKGVPHDRLPGETFGGRTCYFVERFPVLSTTDSVPVFGFVDAGLKTRAEWERYLKRYRSLFQSLDRAVLFFASVDSRRFDGAEQLFRQTITATSTDGAFDTERLQQYFMRRKQFDEKQFESFDRMALDRLREDKKLFAGAHFDSLYHAWLSTRSIPDSHAQRNSIELRGHQLPYTYDWLTPVRSLERTYKQCP